MCILVTIARKASLQSVSINAKCKMWEGGKKQRSAYNQERNVNWTVTKLSLLWNALQFICNICGFTSNAQCVLESNAPVN